MKSNNKFLIGQVYTYCEQVDTGNKLVAELNIKKDQYDEIIYIIASRGLSYKFCYFDQTLRYNVWIYKYPFVAKLIESFLMGESDKATPESQDVWVVGKLFGYSDYEIMRFIEAQGLT